MNEERINKALSIVNEKFNEEYALDLNNTTKDKICFIHSKCGKKTLRTYKASIKAQKGICQYCTPGVLKDHEWFVYTVESLVGGEYTVNSKYTKQKVPVDITHNVCGKMWSVTPDNFIRRGSRCPYCEGNHKMDTEYFVKSLSNLYQKEYTVLGEYINAREPISIKHNVCGNIWSVAPYSILRGNTGCPNCKSSKGEKLVSKILDSLNIEYEYQKKFKDLVYKNNLVFDFYIPSVNTAIEYDGIQHFKPTNFGGVSDEVANENLEHQVIKDKLKNNYCIKNGIKLLRIPYTMSNKEVKGLIESKVRNL